MSGWLMTSTGRAFYPFRPRAEDVDIEDIAHALSLTCRFGGHVRKFYSVAEHSVHVGLRIAATHPQLAMAALLHDAAEAYLGDLPRPLKKGLIGAAGGGIWLAAEQAVEEAIGVRFGVTLTPMSPLIKAVDDRILLDEWAVLMPPTEADIGVSGEPLGIEIFGWDAAGAKDRFLRLFEVFGGQP